MTLAQTLKLHNSKSMISICGGGGKTTTLFSLAEELNNSRVLITTTTKILNPQSSELYDLIIEKNSGEFIDRIKADNLKNLIICGSSSNSDTGKLNGCTPAFIEEIRYCFDYIIIESDGSAGKPVKAPAEHEPVICDSTNLYIGVIGLDCLGRKADKKNVHRPQLFSLIRGKCESELITADDLLELINNPLGLFKNAPDNCRRIVLLNKADLISEESGKRIVQILAEGSEKPVQVILNSFKKKESVVFSV